MNKNKGIPSLESRMFQVAFCPAELPISLLRSWSDIATDTIRVLIEFRSSLHKWQATGQVPQDELAAEYERLAAVGLEGWLDGILGI